MSYPSDGQPRFLVTSVQGYTISPTFIGTRLRMRYQVLDRGYCHALVREFGGIHAEARAEKLAKRLERKHTERPVSPRPEAQHGTISGYVTLRCRCVACSAANRDYMRSYRAKQKQSVQ